MKSLIKSATIVDSKSDFNNQIVDILIQDGIITKIAKEIKNIENYPEIRLDNLHVSQGWFDSSVSFGEPGYEERETLENGLLTAAKSGYTAVALNANTNPVLDKHSDISFLLAKTKDNAVNIRPIGALTKASEGIDLAELYDMKNAGAIAFSDYKKSISNPNLLKIALQYASNFNALVMSYPHDINISGKGIVNENINSTRLGLKGIPALSETIQIARDLNILEYTEGKLHIPTISTAKSVALIRDAKAKNLDITCSVAIHNLCLTDDKLEDFNSNYKVQPPLRTQKDIDALIEGLKDSTIDMVTTDHNPIDIEHKKVEFDQAENGTIGLESAFGALQNIFNTKKTIELLTQGKSRFGFTSHSINEGNKADITLFNPEKKYVFTEKHIYSSSKNSCFLGENLKGKVYGIIANNKIEINND